MKKLLLSVFVLTMVVTISNAQTEQGSMIVGGDVSLDFQKEKQSLGGTSTDMGKSTIVNLNPLFGYFFMDGLAAGLEVNFSNSTFKPEQIDGKGTSNTIAVGPFVKYYHESGVFGMANVSFGSAKYKNTFNGTTNETTYSNFWWRVGAGYAVFLNESISLEPMLSYQSYTNKVKDSDPESKDITSGLQISAGFHIFLK